MRLLNILVPAVLIALVLFMGLYNLGGDLMNDDEGTYLYASWRVSLGEIPYRDFFVVQMPLSLYVTAGLFKLFGPEVWWARAASFLLILGTGFLICAASIKFFGFSRNLSLAMAGLFLLTKHIYFLGRIFMPDSFMIFLCAAALYFALKAEHRAPVIKQKWALFLFGIFSGLAVLAKFNGALLFGGYLLYSIYLLVRKMERPRDILQKILVSSAGFLLTFGLIYGLLLIFVPGTYQATLGYHLAKENAAAGIAALPFLRLGQFVGNHNYGLIPIALIGIFFGTVFKERKRSLLLFTTVAFLSLAFIPGKFFLRYIVFALVPLTVFFGDGIRLIGSKKRLRLFAFPVAIALVLLSLGPTFNLEKLRAYDNGTRTVASFVREETMPGDYVFGDDQGINFYAERPCPPRLADVSEATTSSGQVTSVDIRNECDRYSVKLIFVEKGASAHHLKNLRDYPLFEGYLNEHYELVKTMPREFLDVDIYRRKTS
ncbi:MAG: phospholipid carrier-dependent glycosyltransferase [Candidatus Aminicenantes bacterium]|nr:phospholipid carrier-dependent glycosyltransferase [Candidatus Aminicenantes bacterium]